VFEGAELDSSQTREDSPAMDESIGGFGSHFMLNNGQEQENGFTQQEARSPHKKLPNPPKTDVTNPKNKYCMPCNRDFNRRQAFVEHCRNVHNMKIKFTKPVTPGASPSGASPVKGMYNNGLREQFTANNYKCDYCSKGFSSRSNKNRHMLLSCDANAGPPGPNRNGSPEAITNTNQRMNALEPSMSSSLDVEAKAPSSNQQSMKRKSSSHGISSRDNDFIYDPQIRPHRQESEQKCPYPKCDTVYGRSALLKRHLLEVHNITTAQDITVQLPDLEAEKKRIMIKIKSEPVDPEEMLDIQVKSVSNDSQNKIQDEKKDTEQPSLDTLEGSQQEKKVPPLRVKLPISTSPTMQLNTKNATEASSPSQQQSPSTLSQAMKSTKELFSCGNCKFKSNNSYIFGRHRKSCDKKRRLLEKVHGVLEPNDYESNTTNETNLYGVDSGDYQDSSRGALVHEPEDSIEVPVEFDADNENVTNSSSTTNDKILEVHLDVVASSADSSIDSKLQNEPKTFNNGSSLQDDDMGESHSSEDLEIGPDDDDIDDGRDQPEEYRTTDYGVDWTGNKEKQRTQSHSDDTDKDLLNENESNLQEDQTNFVVGHSRAISGENSDTEKLKERADAGKSESIIEERRKNDQQYSDNDVENNMDDGENSLGTSDNMMDELS
jgi:hypothetical protein